MAKLKQTNDGASLNSVLVRRPIQKCFPLFLLPTFIAFCIGFLYPFGKGLFLSFCDFKTTSKWTWSGLNNYMKAFADDSFIHAFWYTAGFALVSLLIINILAFTVAYLLTKGIKGSNIFRTVFFMPNLIGGIVLGYIWSMIFDGILSRYNTSILLNYFDGLAADRLYDDHLHCRIAGCSRRYAGGSQDRRRIRVEDSVVHYYSQRDALHHYLHIPDSDEFL